MPAPCLPIRYCIVLAALGWAQPAPRYAFKSEDLESVIKVEFITRFTDYIVWPSGAFAADSSFQVCTVGEGPLIPHLEGMPAKYRLTNRPVAYRSIADSGNPSGCHILYLAPHAGTELERILSRLDETPVLTIGDSRGYERRGVMINLFVEGTRVRFKINSVAAKSSGLQVSAKLLVLGKPITAGD